MELVIVERVYEKPLTVEHAASFVERYGPCLSLRHIQRVRTYVSKDRMRTVCFYEAPDASSVRDVHDQEGIPYVKIWSADVFEIPGAAPPPGADPGPPGPPRP